MLVETLQNVAHRRAARVTFLSGDVHAAALGQFYRHASRCRASAPSPSQGWGPGVQGPGPQPWDAASHPLPGLPHAVMTGPLRR